MMQKITVIADEGLPEDIQPVVEGLNSDRISVAGYTVSTDLREGGNLFFVITQRPEFWGISPECGFDEKCIVLAGFRGNKLLFARKPEIWLEKGSGLATRRLYGQILWDAFSAEFTLHAQGSVSAFLDLIGAAMLVYTRDGVLLFSNTELENLTGWSIRDLYCRPVDEYLRPVEGMSGEVKDFSVFFREPGKMGPMHFLFRDGTWQTLIYHSYVIPIPAIGLEVLVILTGTHPGTEMAGLLDPGNRLHERAILHDFRNLLQGVVTYTDLMGFELDPQSASYGYLEKMRSELRRAQEILRTLMYPEPTTESTALTVDQFIESLINTFREIVPPNISIEFDAGCPCQAFITPADLGRILRNLIKNAVEAIGSASGKIWVKTEKSNPETIQGEAKFVRIVVSDNGPGIADHLKVKVFQPFFTTHKESGGTGLGLYSVQATVKQNDGIINFESQIGVGTTFVIYLPLAKH